MKQSSSSTVTIFSSNSMEPRLLPALFSDYEREVSEIILNLPSLISQSEPLSRFSFTWTTKRRRSALDSSSSSLLLRKSPATTSSPPPVPQKSMSEATERRPKKVKVEASSPATPLSFSPSESDEKPKHSLLRKSSKKRRREEWVEMIEELTRRRELLRGEMETVRGYHNKLRAFNLALKSKQQELQYSNGKEKEPHLAITKSANLNMDIIQPIIKSHQEEGQMPLGVHQQLLILDQTAKGGGGGGSRVGEKFQYTASGLMNPLMSSTTGYGLAMVDQMVNSVGPRGIPDLNLSFEEIYGLDSSSQPLDSNRGFTDNRAKAAEARKRRMIRIKEMKTNTTATTSVAAAAASIKPPRFR